MGAPSTLTAAPTADTNAPSTLASDTNAPRTLASDTNAPSTTQVQKTLPPSSTITTPPKGTPTPQFLCDENNNFIMGVTYNQISLTDYCPNCGAHPKYARELEVAPSSKEPAVQYCKSQCLQRGCKGFFYQRHQNGHEICGFYQQEETLLKERTWHGHQAGSRVCQLA